MKAEKFFPPTQARKNIKPKSFHKDIDEKLKALSLGECSEAEVQEVLDEFNCVRYTKADIKKLNKALNDIKMIVLKNQPK